MYVTKIVFGIVSLGENIMFYGSEVKYGIWVGHVTASTCTRRPLESIASSWNWKLLMDPYWANSSTENEVRAGLIEAPSVKSWIAFRRGPLIMDIVYRGKKKLKSHVVMKIFLLTGDKSVIYMSVVNNIPWSLLLENVFVNSVQKYAGIRLHYCDLYCMHAVVIWKTRLGYN